MHIPVEVDTHSHPKTFQSPNRFSIFMEEETGNNNEEGDSSTELEDKENVLSNPVSNEFKDSSMKLEDKGNVFSDPVSNECRDL